MEIIPPKECKIHNKEILNICLEENCKDRFLCSSCYKAHNCSHLSCFISLKDFADKNGELILFNETKKEIEKFKDIILQIKKSSYERIDSLFADYLKKLKTEKLDVYFDIELKKLDDKNVYINKSNLNNITLNAVAKAYNKYIIKEQKQFIEIAEVVEKKIENIYSSLEEGFKNILDSYNYYNLLDEYIKLYPKSIYIQKIDDSNITTYKHGNSIQGRVLLDESSEKVYYIPGFDKNKIEIYEDMNNFKNENISNSITLPSKILGTYSVKHKKYFYYFEFNENDGLSNKLVKYDLEYDKVMCTNQILNGDVILDNAQNQWGGYNDIILITDNNQLYAVYSSKSNNKRINIALINEEDLSVLKIWKTDSKVKHDCPCIFMIGSILYHLNSNSKENDTINYAYNLRNEKSYNPNIAFPNKGGYDSSLTFYPKIQSLMTINNGNVYIYKVALTEE